MEIQSKTRSFRVWLTEKRTCIVDIRAEDAWAVKAFAEQHPERWIEIDSEADVDQVLPTDKSDFRPVDEA